jgi:hypothetical protein
MTVFENAKDNPTLPTHDQLMKLMFEIGNTFDEVQFSVDCR